MEEIKNADLAKQEKKSVVDFELDSMEYALKDLPPQNKNVSFEAKTPGSLDEKIKTPPPPDEKASVAKIESSVHYPVQSPSVLKSSLNKFPAPNPSQKPVSTKNTPYLTIVLSVIALLCLSGGAFYYFQYFIKNKSAPTPKTELPASPNAEPVEPTELPTPMTIIQEATPPFSAQTEELILSSETLLEKIASLKQASLDNPALKESLTTGVFYQIKKDDQILSAQEILQAMDAPLPIETASMFQKGWLFAYLNEKSILKTALILSVDSQNYNNSSLLSIEKELPLLFKNLFVGEESTVQEKEVTFQPNLQESRLRYFNFKKDDTSRTTDWAKIGDYLFFTTSKDSAFKLISLLEPN